MANSNKKTSDFLVWAPVEVLQRLRVITGPVPMKDTCIHFTKKGGKPYLVYQAKYQVETEQALEVAWKYVCSKRSANLQNHPKLIGWAAK